MSQDIITIEVNGQPIKAKAGSMLIEATDAAGIEVPRFCYHKKLSVAANCRMCLIEVEKVPKALPACSTPVTPNMKVWTHSERAVAAQQDVMEFLLINHPLDCPICDQGGECELQDVSIAYGTDKSWFSEEKRVVFDKNIGPLISTELTRCIQCTRCVRFGEEIAGMRELGMVGRGDREKIDVFVNKSLQSELSGNAIDICPVGALTAKPSRFKARAWEIMQHEGIASHDCVGSNVYHHTFQKQLMRTVPRDNDAINECWISDRDRFSYEGIMADDRLQQPMIKKSHGWVEVDWEEALQAVAETLKGCKPASIAGLASPRATVEELYLFQKLLRQLGCHDLDHRLRQTDFSDQEQEPLFPWLGMPIEAVQQQDTFLLIGSNVRFEQPMLNHRIRQAALGNQASVMAINPFVIDFNFDGAMQSVSSPSDLVANLYSLAKALGVALPNELDVVLTPSIELMAEQLKAGERKLILLGSIAMQHPEFATLRNIASLIAEKTSATLGYLPPSANSAGAWLSGFVPHRLPLGETAKVAGKHVGDILSGGSEHQCFVMLDVEADYDCDDPQQAKNTLKQAESVIAITAYANHFTKDVATILLPASVITETSGSLVNVEGRWQSFKGVSQLPGQARPTWKILRVLGNVLGLNDFDYVSSDQVRDELKARYDEMCADTPLNNAYQTSVIKIRDADIEARLQRIGNVAMFAGDSLLRRATSLQKTRQDYARSIHINPQDAEALGLQNEKAVAVAQGDSGVNMALTLDESIPVGCAQILAGTDKSAKLGSAFGSLAISKIG